MTRNALRFGRYDYAAFSASVCFALCSLSIPLMIVEIGETLEFPLDRGGMAAGGMLHLFRSAAMVAALLLCGSIAGSGFPWAVACFSWGRGRCCALWPPDTGC